MESSFRYDFSFPPKSSSFNSNSNNNHYHHHHQQQQHQHHSTSHVSHNSQNHGRSSYSNHHTVHQQQRYVNGHGKSCAGNAVNQYTSEQTTTSTSSGVVGSTGLPKSASTSFLFNCVGNNAGNANVNNNNTCFHNNNNNNNNSKEQNFCTSCNSKNSVMKNTEVPTNLPQTPKESDCSFTFDDLKNTLAFMEDSPLVTASGTNNSRSAVNHININPTSNSSTVEPAATTADTLILISAGSGSEITSDSGLSSASLASSGSTSSSSSASSSSYNSSADSQPLCDLPNSTSNPMLLSIASQSANNQQQQQQQRSHTVISSYNLVKSDCNCSSSTGNDCMGSSNAQFHQQKPFGDSGKHTAGFTGTAIDLLIKKSPSSSSSSSSSSSQFYNRSRSSSLLTTTTGINNHHNPQQQHQQFGGNMTLNMGSSSSSNINTAVECAAKKYRCAAQVSEATCCWKGKLPPKQYKTPLVYSTKVFVGGLPWDITEEDIVKEFGIFGPCRVEWTNKEKYNLTSNSSSGNNGNVNGIEYNNAGNGANSFRNYRSMSNLQQQQQNGKQGVYQANNNGISGVNNDEMMNASSSKQRSSPGFAYVIYDNEYSVRSLVGNCIEDYQNGRDRVEYYFKISTRRVRNKEVQIIPWILADNNFALCTPKDLDPKKTVFVGNLHGTMTARDLAHIMNELFGCVVYAGIDIDKLKYPIGSGRVTFSHQQNFMRAVRAAFVDLQSPKFSKRIQIDPYLEDVQCCICYGDKGIYFCRDFECFNYYCGICWEKQHSFSQHMGTHKPLMRKREDK